MAATETRTETSPDRPIADSVPRGVRETAAWSWRVLVIGALVVAVGAIFKRFEDVFFPMALALLFAALLRPVVDRAVRRGVPKIVAVLASILVTLAAVIAILGFAIQQGIAGGPELIAQLTETINDTKRWLIDGPLHLDANNIRSVADEILQWLQSHEGKIASGALGTAAFAGRVSTGLLLTLFLLVFFLYDGPQIWRYVTRVVPEGSRARVRGAGAAGFGTLEAYVRATVIVAAIDAAVIGIGLAILGVPLVLPLVAIIFLGSFIPIVGSFVAGTLAVFVALTTQGWVNALIVLGVLVFVMAFEGHILQPFVLGHSVKLHPVAIILAIALGIMLAGIVGGLLAVPLLSFVYTAAKWRPGQPPPVHRDSRFAAWLRRKTGRQATTVEPVDVAAAPESASSS